MSNVAAAKVVRGWKKEMQPTRRYGPLYEFSKISVGMKKARDSAHIPTGESISPSALINSHSGVVYTQSSICFSGRMERAALLPHDVPCTRECFSHPWGHSTRWTVRCRCNPSRHCETARCSAYGGTGQWSGGGMERTHKAVCGRCSYAQPYLGRPLCLT